MCVESQAWLFNSSEQAKCGGQHQLQSLTLRRNKHPQSHRIVLQFRDVSDLKVDLSSLPLINLTEAAICRGDTVDRCLYNVMLTINWSWRLNLYNESNVTQRRAEKRKEYRSLWWALSLVIDLNATTQIHTPSSLAQELRRLNQQATKENALLPFVHLWKYTT